LQFPQIAMFSPPTSVFRIHSRRIAAQRLA
jgi:hypothetical protein